MTTYQVDKVDFDLLVTHHPFDHDTVKQEGACPKCRAMRRIVRGTSAEKPVFRQGRFANPTPEIMHQAAIEELEAHYKDGDLVGKSRRQIGEHLAWQKKNSPWLPADREVPA